MSTETEYKDDPTWEEFLGHIPRFAKSPMTSQRIIEKFEQNGYKRPETIMDLTFRDLEMFECLSNTKARILYEHLLLYKNKGKITRTIEDLQMEEKRIEIISSGSQSLDTILPGGGFETGSIYEIVGGPIGKTQLCLTIACNTMKSKKQGGLNRSVLWIDSQRDFHTDRLLQVAGDIPLDRIKKRFNYSKINTLDELELILDNLGKEKWEEIGSIIIDSLILPIKQQYPTHGHNLSNLKPLRAHLITIFRKLKNLSNRYNFLFLFTNTLYEPIGQRMYYRDQYRPEGEVEVEHGSDMRLLLDRPNKKERDEFGIPYGETGDLVRVTLQNSNRMPERKGFFAIKNEGCTGSVNSN